MDKREQILNALQALLRQGRAGTASVQDIAREAGIAKGGMYYYFKSKEEALDALAQRQYAAVLAACQKALDQEGGTALERLRLLMGVYRSTAVDASVDRMLHQTENAAIHQKSMAFILQGLSPLLGGIYAQGVEEGTFTCEDPAVYAEMTLSVLVFLLDPGVFTWTPQEAIARLQGLSGLLEKGLCAPADSFTFLYEAWGPQTLAQ